MTASRRVRALRLPAGRVTPTDRSRGGPARLPRADRSGRLPLSHAQEQLWLGERLRLSVPLYNVPLAVRLPASLSREDLSSALTELVLRHEALRTAFGEDDGVPYQCVRPVREPPIKMIELTGEDPAAAEARLAGLLEEFGQAPFDLVSGQLLRALAVRLGPAETVLALCVHHLACDGHSLNRLLDELAALAEGVTLPPIEVQYGDFAVWDRSEPPERASGIAYWRDRLRDLPMVLDLPLDRPRPATWTGRGARLVRTLPGDLAARLRETARRLGVTPFTVLFTACQVVVSRYSGAPDFLLGVPTLGRGHPEVAGVVGNFVTMLPVGCRVEPGASFAELAARTAADLAADLAHEHVPLQVIARELAVPRDLSRAPLTQAVFTHNAVRMRTDGVERLHVDTATAKYDLTFSAAEYDAEIDIGLECAEDLFERATAESLLSSYGQVLAAVAADPDRRVADLLTPAPAAAPGAAEADAALLEPDGLHLRLAETARRRPGALAVSGGGVSMSYGELDARARLIAGWLHARGVGRGDLVAVHLARTPDLIAALAGVLYAGAGYLPLEPAHPDERVLALIDDAGVAAVMCERDLAGEVAHRMPVMPVLLPGAEAGSAPYGPESTLPDETAYVIYTSGSTGTPKGVVITHGNALALLADAGGRIAPTEDEVWTLFHSVAFDFSVWEIWGALLSGGRLVVVPWETARIPESFAALLRDEGVTVLSQTPTAFRELAALAAAGACPPLALRWVVFGGEALDPATVRLWWSNRGAERPRLANLYGITETTVHVTFHELTPETLPPSVGTPIGRPLDRWEVLLLDADGREVIPGAVGEIHVSGAGLARGYLNRPRLTAERFVPHPHRPGRRLYRSGDLARLRPDGTLEYLGRGDQQIKIRGVRVELGEVEAVLAVQPGVTAAAAALRTSASGRPVLVGYLAGSADPTEVRRRMTRLLPEPMVPSVMVVVDRLPLTGNGKLDRAALPAPGRRREGVDDAPVTPAEKEVAAVWSELLGLEPGRVGRDDNFFGLGGDSILALRVVARLAERGLRLRVEDVFAAQTLAEQAAEATAKTPGPEAAPARVARFAGVSADDVHRMPPGLADAYPLTMLQAGMLYHQESGGEHPPYHNVTTLRVAGPVDLAALQQAYDLVVARHPVLRTSFDLASYGEPLQLVHERVRGPIGYVDLGSLDLDGQEEAVRAWMTDRQRQPLDLSAPPLLRLHVLRCGPEEMWLGLVECHAILDGWSLTSTLQEILDRYGELLVGSPPTVEAPPEPSFHEYVLAERAAAANQEAAAYWDGLVSGVEPPRLPAAAENPRPARRRVIPLGEEVAAGLAGLAVRAGVPLKSVLLAAHAVAVSRLAGVSEVLTGLVTNGRLEHGRGDETRGLFLNTVPVRLPGAAASWEEAAMAAFDAERELQPYRRRPGGLLQRAVGGRALLETFFNYTSFHSMSLGTKHGGIRLTSGFREQASTDFPLMASFDRVVADGVEHLTLLLGVNEPYAEEEQIAEMYASVLRAAARGHPAPAAHAELPPGDRLLTEGEGEHVTWPPGETLVGVIGAKSRACEGAVAVTEGATGLTLTYAELWARAGALAERLRAIGVTGESHVGVRMSRSARQVVAVLGIAMSGAAYVPLEPDAAELRLRMILDDADPVLVLDDDADLSPPAGPRPPAVAADADARTAAYVIFTSGSTGRPKGVVVEQAALYNRIAWAQRAFPLGPGDRVLMKTPIGFDVSVWEFFWPLLAGARIVVAPPEAHRDLGELVRLIRREEPTVVHFVPSVLERFLAEPGSDCPSLRLIVCSGEALHADLAARTLARMPWARLENLYGPTEAAIDVTSATAGAGAGAGAGTVPIGRPIANTVVRVLDPAGRPVPVGAAGELYLGGAGLARGYLGRPALTAARFVPDPYGRPGGRLYRTGDRVRWTRREGLEFLGRLDDQIKIGGMRLEPGEIEAALASAPGIAAAAAVLRPLGGGRHGLAAFVVPEHTAVDAQAVRRHLGRRLPAAAQPARLETIGSLPLTPNGKLDRAALRALPLTGDERDERVPPRTPEERLLADLWRQVLGVAVVGVHDDFYALGGDSILALQIAGRARAAGLPVQPRDVLTSSTIARLAEAGARAAGDEPGGDEPGVPADPLRAPLTPIQRWFLDVAASNPGRIDQYALLELSGPVDPNRLADAVRLLLETHPMLRSRLTGDGWFEVCPVPDDGLVETIDLADVAPERHAERVQEIAWAAVRDWPLDRPPRIRFFLLNRGHGRPPWLLVAAHHLATDAVSWQVIFDDLAAIATGTPPRPVATGFPAYARALADYASSPRALAQRPYWRAIQGGATTRLPAAPMADPGDLLSEEVVRCRLERDATGVLLARAGGHDIMASLLGALSWAFGGWVPDGELAVMRLHHGRTLPHLPQADLSRAVGWCTGMHPVLLPVRGAGSPADAAARMAGRLTEVPDDGVGFGALRWHGGHFADVPPPDVAFNYIGQGRDRPAWNAVARLVTPGPRDRRIPGEKRGFRLWVQVAVADGELVADWQYSVDRDRREVVAAAADRFAAALRALAAERGHA
ncbi:amino acid adenylation domain-containing protein [Nonomuraea sp. NPDC048916]|uniref:amino acid adenylation domain-containing protein n=1 Tax=Nonomuraea sp. NPDC048916 TaxID=3154232 RepID=UPI0033DCC289